MTWSYARLRLNEYDLEYIVFSFPEPFSIFVPKAKCYRSSVGASDVTRLTKTYYKAIMKLKSVRPISSGFKTTLHRIYRDLRTSNDHNL